jgi:hypothetical protein
MKLIVVGNLGERVLLKGPLYQKVADDGKVTVGKDIAGKDVLIIVLKPVPLDKSDYSEDESPGE